MKRIITILTLIIVFSGLSLKSQEIAFCYKGEWSIWYQFGYYSNMIWLPESKYFTIKRALNMSGLSIYSLNGIPILSFQINNFTFPTKKERKQHKKTDQWFTYNGTVEYYVNDEYPTAQDLAKKDFLVVPNARKDKTPTIKRTTSCKISIAPFNKEPEIWNIFFDDIGIGISTKGLKFKK